jgi:hypothetical protein
MGSTTALGRDVDKGSATSVNGQDREPVQTSGYGRREGPGRGCAQEVKGWRGGIGEAAARGVGGEPQQRDGRARREAGGDRQRTTAR